ncbi:MAG: gluconokinase [Bacteroidetes bacterium]|nr:MAG: gluconokinase [Bacteroidota bacterium]
MGVSGCGKTTIGKMLSNALNIPFYDADDFHLQSNIKKMRSGFPLNDGDRFPWLNILANNLKLWNDSEGAILSCSALKEKYRQQLSKEVSTIKWIYLEGSYDIIKQRIENRTQHYQKSNMLQSQFDILEVPNYGIHININNEPQDIITYILNKINNNE